VDANEVALNVDAINGVSPDEMVAEQAQIVGESADEREGTTRGEDTAHIVEVEAGTFPLDDEVEGKLTTVREDDDQPRVSPSEHWTDFGLIKG